MIEECRRYIEEKNMIQQGDLVITGVSGGADSLCLFHMLNNLKEWIGFTLEVVHVEHGIRGAESKKDASFVEELCRNYQVSCRIYAVDVPSYSKENHLGTEEAARELRYNAFTQEVYYAVQQGIAAEKIKIALAHHEDDNAETILFQMLRGSGIAGLCGIKPVRKETQGFSYIRPLLWASRNQIEGYLQEIGQEFRVDSTNMDISYSRNRLRQNILPELKQINTESVRHINQTAKRLECIQDYLAVQAQTAYRECVMEKERENWIELSVLNQLHPALRDEVIKLAVYEAAGQKKDIGAVHIDAVRSLCNQQSGKSIKLPYGVMVRREFGRLVLQKPKEGCMGTSLVEKIREDKIYSVSSALLQELKNTGEEAVFSVGEGQFSLKIIKFLGNLNKIPKKTYTKFLDYDMIKNGFTIRTRRPGDYICMDSAGHHKKLKEYFIQEKVPKGLREEIWLIAQDSRILWVTGLRMSEDCKITEKTLYGLKIQYHGGTKDGLFQET